MASRTRFGDSSLAKSGVIAVLILLFALPAFAQQEYQSRARISFSEVMWDFGYVPKTGKVVHIYEVRNIGEDTLIIAKVRTTCGCTTTPLSKERIAPDEATDMKVVFDPEKLMAGDQTKRKLQVISNDPIHPIAEVQFTAKLGKANSLVKVYPAGINFDTVSRDAGAVRTVTLENISGEKLSLRLIEGPGEEMEVELPGKSLDPGEKAEMTLTIKEGTTSGSLHTSVTLDFECSKIARISIPIAAVIAQE